MKKNPKLMLHLFMHIGRLLEGLASEKLEKNGLYHGQGRILSALNHFGETTQADIARGLEIRPATVTNMIQRMEKSGLVKRSVDPVTNRAVIAELTTSGRKAAERVEQTWESIEPLIVKMVPKKRAGEFRKILEQVRNGLGGNEFNSAVFNSKKGVKHD